VTGRSSPRLAEWSAARKDRGDAARSSRDLHNILHELQERTCGFLSLGEAWCDTTTDGTKFGRPPALDAGQRRKIADRYAAGETMADLAIEYDVSEPTIWPLGS
jgi:hypothetical protein